MAVSLQGPPSTLLREMQGKESYGVCVVGSDWGSDWAGGLVGDCHLGRHGEGQSEEVTLGEECGRQREEQEQTQGGPGTAAGEEVWEVARRPVRSGLQIMGFTFGEAMVGFKQGSDML